MNVKTKAIVISTTKFQDNSLIVKCFTQSDGLKSYLVKNAFSKTKKTSKAAYFQPLTVLEIEANHKNKGKLEFFKEINIAEPLQNIHFDITKSSIVLFLSEVIHHSIREEEQNEPLFIFLETAIYWLDANSYNANFHLITLLEMTKYLGFYPDIETFDNHYFEPLQGVFITKYTEDCWSENESNLFKKLFNLKFEDTNLFFHNSERKLLLKKLLHYYELHIDSFRKNKSLEVLFEVFA